MSGGAAIDFVPEAFSMDAVAPMGRQAAGEGFLAAWAKWSGRDRFVGHVRDEAAGAAFVRRMGELAPERTAVSCSSTAPAALAQEGVLFAFRPELSQHAWRRRSVGSTRYSLCGLTHTLSSHLAMEAVTSLMTAPLEPWDALICTSRSVRAVVETLWERQVEYLRERLGAHSVHAPQLPVIPLGVDVDRFHARPGDREKCRQHFGLKADDVCLIYMGRLSAHAKANPLPMFLALEQAARASGRRVQLLLVGWLANDGQAQIFREGAARLAPSAVVKLVDGRIERLRYGAFAAADIFCQLVDNIQESFGLAPVEAMAAGLPLVVSDWDGFRDTVEDGVHGFRIPTVASPPGAGDDLADRYDAGVDTYDVYVGGVSQFVSVDVGAAANALARLITDPELRGRMGAAGRKTARETFDWRHVIARYQDLWCELEARRRAGPPGPARPGRRPDRPDPFALFAGFSTRRLEPGDEVSLGPTDWGIEALPGVVLVPDLLPNRSGLTHLLARLREGPATVGSLMADQQLDLGPDGRTLTWLAKFAMVRISPAALSGAPGLGDALVGPHTRVC